MDRVIGGWQLQHHHHAAERIAVHPDAGRERFDNGNWQLSNRIGSGNLTSGRILDHWFNTSIDPNDRIARSPCRRRFQFGNSGYEILRGRAWPLSTSPSIRTFQSPSVPGFSSGWRDSTC